MRLKTSGINTDADAVTVLGRMLLVSLNQGLEFQPPCGDMKWKTETLWIGTDLQHKVVTFEWKALEKISPSAQKRQESYALEINVSSKTHQCDLYFIWV